jgi:5-methylcytosine-specific restriction endonuclease McrA
MADAPLAPEIPERPVYEVVREEFACACSETVVRKKVDKLGRTGYLRQCLECGETTALLKHAEIPFSERMRAGPIDEEIGSRRRERMRARQSELYEEQSRERRWQYEQDRLAELEAYYETPWWRSRSQARLELDKYRCQARLPHCLGAASQVHHVSYKHLGAEPLFDLASVCEPCHARMTRASRARRGIE